MDILPHETPPELSECLICVTPFEETSYTIFDPCKHALMCADCTAKLFIHGPILPRCPKCRQFVSKYCIRSSIDPPVWVPVRARSKVVALILLMKPYMELISWFIVVYSLIIYLHRGGAWYFMIFIWIQHCALAKLKGVPWSVIIENTVYGMIALDLAIVFEFVIGPRIYSFVGGGVKIWAYALYVLVSGSFLGLYFYAQVHDIF